MDSALQEFILAHENDDIQKMLLSVPKDGNGIDIKKAATIIEARKKAKDKIPSFYAEPDITYPGRISVEQCSSEATARYKRRFIPYRGCCVCDLTGGLGVDSYFLGMDAGKILYLERDKDTFEAAKHNFKALKADNIVVINADCESIGKVKGILSSYSANPELIFVDPSRRDANDHRKYALSDCSPDIIPMAGELLDISERVLVKASPMIDISFIHRTFPMCSEIHSLSVGNECKEVLFMLEKNFAAEPVIFATDLNEKDFSVRYTIGSTFSEENESNAEYVDSPEELMGQCNAMMLFLPGKAVLKAGFFKLPCTKFGLKKIDPSTHLYVGKKAEWGFPGKMFSIKEVLYFNKGNLLDFKSRYPFASVSAMNFPVTAESLRKRLGTKESADIHVFACSCASKNIMIIAESLKNGGKTSNRVR